MKTGKEPFKCGMASAECEMGNPQITPIAQISFSSSASSAKSADKTSHSECVAADVSRLKLLSRRNNERTHVRCYDGNVVFSAVGAASL